MICVIAVGVMFLHMKYVDDINQNSQAVIIAPIKAYLAEKYPGIEFHVVIRDSEYSSRDKFSGLRTYILR